MSIMGVGQPRQNVHREWLQELSGPALIQWQLYTARWKLLVSDSLKKHRLHWADKIVKALMQ